MDDSAQDPAAAGLERIRERAERVGGGVSSNLNDYINSAMDVPRLLAAVERLSKLADEWEAKAAEIGAQLDLDECQGATAGFKMIGHMNHRDHAAKVREAITSALTGGPDG